MKIANINKAYLGNTIINGIGDYYRYFDNEVAPAYDNIVLGTCRAGTTGMVMQIDEVQYPVTIDGTNFSFHYTGSTLESLGGAFFGNTNLVSITYIGLDTRNNKRLNNMFQGNSNLTSVNFEGMPVIGIISLESMFYQASKITSLDLHGWDTSQVTTTENCFVDATRLKTLDISGWDLSNASNTRMFYRCIVRDIYMDGCNDTTLTKIQNALEYKDVCTIHRDGYKYNYVNGQWIESQDT